jgi:dTDP-4-amino-4,6-dideoxygalactose transaminase
MYRIPFNRACLTGKELDYISEAVTRGHISGDGEFSRKCADMLQRQHGACRVLLTPSCTHALEMSALLLNLQPGDEVIFPSFTFVSTANAFVLHGATPIFADIRSDTLNIDETQLQQLITSRTRAIVVVHYAGVGCEMNHIQQLAADHGLSIVEDNAHGLFGKYFGKYLGTFGVFATQSFHETKNLTCGEGGALIINDEQYVQRAEIIREKGTNRSQFFRGQIDKYTWMDVGSSYLLSDALAAFLYAQLEQWQSIQTKRRQIWETYFSGLQEWAKQFEVRLPFFPQHCEPSYHMFQMIVPTLEFRQKLITHLKEREILAVFHYQPLHLSPMGRKFGGKPGDCPITEDISDRLIRLPFYNSLTQQEQAEVISAVTDFHD